MEKKAIVDVQPKKMLKKRQKVKRRNEEGLTPKQQELKELKTKVLNLKEQGVSYRKIAENVNITLGKVQRLLKWFDCIEKRFPL